MTLAPFLTVSRLFLRCVLCSAPDHVPLYGFPCVPDLSIPPECEYHLLPGPSRTDTPFQPQSHLPIPVQQPPAQRPDFRIPASGGHLFRTALESRREAGGLSCDDGLALRFSERIASWGPDRCGISGSPPRGYDESSMGPSPRAPKSRLTLSPPAPAALLLALRIILGVKCERAPWPSLPPPGPRAGPWAGRVVPRTVYGRRQCPPCRGDTAKHRSPQLAPN